ncbi:MAG: ABC transporter permease, partial [Thermoanaerobaculia bacterium]
WDVSMDFDIDAGETAEKELHETVFRMLDEAKAFPEVEEAALSNTPPYSFSTSEGTRDMNGRMVRVLFDDVSDDFAKVMKLTVVRGRWFGKEDDAAQHPPIVIDENAANAIWPGEDPIGKKWEAEGNTSMQVVGVVKPYRKDGEVSSPMNVIFHRIGRQHGQGRLGSHILVRLAPGTPASFEVKLAQRLQQIGPKVSFRVRHMDQMRTNMHRMRLAPLIAGGVVGTFLIAMVALGLTGVLWQTVTRRTRELGVRRAMGASGASVNRQILAEVALLTTIALILGSIIVLQLPILGAFSVVSPAAFTTGFIGALATIYALTVLCGLYPSWLASRLQPADALRYE